jgi:hypothetical protein
MTGEHKPMCRILSDLHRVARSRSCRLPDCCREQVERFEYEPISLAAAAHWRLVRGLIRRHYDVVPQRPCSVVQRNSLRNGQFEFDLPVTTPHTCATLSTLIVLRCKSLHFIYPDYESQSSQNLSAFGAFRSESTASSLGGSTFPPSARGEKCK